ncbi:MAG TPA: adenosine deaminase [Rhizomicrobium sp.]|jgi:adenosine deaminase|nr:adenosine deaminase [Rhizomicrobium sp.]
MTTPLAELHCHLEGSVGPALARRLAARHGSDLSGLFAPDGRYAWSGFAGFIAAYDKVSETIRTAEDYHDITYDYFANAARQGLIYGEVFVSPSHAARKGLSYEAQIDAVARAMASVETEFGTVARIIVTCVRHLGPQRAEEIARLTRDAPHPCVVGFGMGGDENFGKPADYAKAFAIARDGGLGITCHAGELAGPRSVRDTLAALNPARLGHGVRAGEDPALLAELKARGPFLELCPGSNIALKLFADYAAHPVVRYAEMGLRCGISTDDPGFFADSIGEEYARVAAAHGLGPQAMLAFTRMSLEAAFCDAATKARLLARLDFSPGAK